MGSIAGTGVSIVFVLASSVRVPLAELAISNGLFPGLAGVVKTLAGEVGPDGIRVNGLLPVRIATDRVRQLDALRGDPDEVRARLSEGSRCGDMASPKSSAEPPRSCCRRPLPTSPER